MKFARVDEGIVREIVDLPDGWVPGVNVYHSKIAAQFHAITANLAVTEGWTFDGTSFSSPVELTSPKSARKEKSNEKDNS